VAEQLANNAATTLTAGIPDAVATSCTVANGTVFPASGNFRIIIDSELLLCTARTGNTLTVTRGVEATTAASHANGAAVTHVLTKGGLDQYLADRELAYAEFTAPVTVSSTSETAPTLIVTTGSISCDGTPIRIEFFAPTAVLPASVGAVLFLNFWVDGADQGRAFQATNPLASSAMPVQIQRRYAASAGAHTFSVRGWNSAGSTTVYGGAGGAGPAYIPGFIRVTRA
jgi:hypothetical protein